VTLIKSYAFLVRILAIRKDLFGDFQGAYTRTDRQTGRTVITGKESSKTKYKVVKYRFKQIAGNLLRGLVTIMGHNMAQLVEALHHKPAGAGSISDGFFGIFH